MTQNEFLDREKHLYASHDAAAAVIFGILGSPPAGIKLCGGTALARFYLHHRLSYDLDFFLPHGFDAQSLLVQLGRNAPIEHVEITHDSVKADQLHFTAMLGDVPVKMSFIEDMYSDLYPPVLPGLLAGEHRIAIEGIGGLYHRKLRTVVGWAGPDAIEPQGGRQKARDMFDLYVLSRSHAPLRSFIDQLPYKFPIDAFEAGIAFMPWHALADELSEIMCASQWSEGCDVHIVRQHLFQEIGMEEIAQEFDDAGTASPAPGEKS